MRDCNHSGYRRYVRRVFPDGSVHVCVQCINCLDIVKLPGHNNRPFIRASEVPPGRAIHEWISREELV